jgi:thiol:disulfide interchange protein
MVGANSYTIVTVTYVTATDIYFTHNGGMGNAKIKDLSPELKKHFHYNEAKAAAVETQQAQANAQYRAAVVRLPSVQAPDESREQEQAPAAGGAAQWGTDFPAALSEAQSQNKLVLLDFTGSDWCPWCIKFEHEVLSTSQFADYAGNKLVLVRLDFPHNIPQSEE